MKKPACGAGLGEAETVLRRVGLFFPMDAIREIEQAEQSQADKLHEKQPEQAKTDSAAQIAPFPHNFFREKQQRMYGVGQAPQQSKYQAQKAEVAKQKAKKTAACQLSFSIYSVLAAFQGGRPAIQCRIHSGGLKSSNSRQSRDIEARQNHKDT